MAAAMGLLAVVAPSAGAGTAIGPVNLEGVVSCDAATGNQVVSWTLTNLSGQTITITSAVTDGDGMITPGPIDATATMSPSVVADDGTSTGETRVTGDGEGDFHLVVSFTGAQAVGNVDGEVILPGGCVQTTTTSTTAVVVPPTTGTSTTLATTTTAPPAAAPVAATPSYTG